MQINRIKNGVLIGLCVLLFALALYGINKYRNWHNQKMEFEAGQVFNLAEQLRLEQKWAGALDQYKLILTKYPRYAGKLEAEFKIANIYLHNLFDLQEAAKYYTEIIKQKDRYNGEKRVADAMIELADIYRAQGQPREAIGFLEEVQAEYPIQINKQYVYSQLVALYGQVGDQQKLADVLQKQRGGL
jgi:TolA-binding protein